jgi:diadenosine tetraphosphate (Ap4A) HIT family hydrolase
MLLKDARQVYAPRFHGRSGSVRMPPMAKCVIEQRFEAAERGENPTVIGRMKSGWLVLGDQQSPRGWCILIAAPLVKDLNALDEAGRVQFLSDMTSVGDVMMKVAGSYRINYSILGNVDPFLHAHIQPRYQEEPEVERKAPVWTIKYPTPTMFDAKRDAELMDAVRRELRAMGRVVM